MLQKLGEDEPQVEKPLAELDHLGHTDWVRRGPLLTWGRFVLGEPWVPGLRLFSFLGQARLWVQLMRELRHGVKLKKVQEQEFNPLPTEFQLTPFEMLMQDIRARNYKLRKVMVSRSSVVLRQQPWPSSLLWVLALLPPPSDPSLCSRLPTLALLLVLDLSLILICRHE